LRKRPKGADGSPGNVKVMTDAILAGLEGEDKTRFAKMLALLPK
jgi:hypothetical protein